MIRKRNGLGYGNGGADKKEKKICGCFGTTGIWDLIFSALLSVFTDLILFITLSRFHNSNTTCNYADVLFFV